MGSVSSVGLTTQRDHEVHHIHNRDRLVISGTGWEHGFDVDKAITNGGAEFKIMYHGVLRYAFWPYQQPLQIRNA